ncbi:hypothetical protein CISG_07824 [Coccidioides immitis RMSCC 3703]|uniref:Uncharacterized protein n=2 Tax=Coccidioides immitis TaxID=5501 RepID=A0A0J8R6H4_COCIT|nr:hypothetical protein CIRG_10344 [Coccidioides immitis RMSCC 2394]KMU79338.1 hypothetical protein CISG_07824 [Coccidioides immitis RMSCC 3703]
MSSGCKLYRQQRELCQQEAGSSTTTDEEIEQWDWFIGIAWDSSKIKRSQLNTLKQVSRCWGQEKLQYYGWPSLGVRFCKLLATAANQIASWEEACIKLNRLMLRRIQTHGRRPIRHAKHPISQIDLENLKKWTHRNPYIKDNNPERESHPFQQLGSDKLPNGYGVDKFSLFVLEDFAASPNSDGQNPESESRESESGNEGNNLESESDQESESGNEGNNPESKSGQESESGNEDKNNTKIPHDLESN